MTIDVRQEALEAEERIRPHIRETPAEPSLYLSKLGNCEVILKCENLQITGSFKLRGAMNKFLSLSESDKKQTLVTASSGNHGTAFAYIMKKFAAKGVIYLPETVSPAKVESLRLLDADLRFHGDDCIKAERLAKQTAETSEGQKWLSPYNDPKIIGGQGTIGIELERQVGKVDAILAPVGGGGLIGGLAGYLKAIDSKVEVIGCQPENSAVMYESVKAGEILDLESKPTISDGTAGGIEAGAITFDLVRRYVDDFILADEGEIADAIKLMLEKHCMLVEGSGALSVACFVKARERFASKRVVLILSGSKISLDTLKQVLS